MEKDPSDKIKISDKNNYPINKFLLPLRSKHCSIFLINSVVDFTHHCDVRFFFHFLGKYCGKICSARSFLPPSCAHQFSSSVCSQKCTVKSHLNRKILGCNVCVVSSCEILCIDKQSLAEYVIDARKQKTEYFAPSSWQTALQKVWVQSELLSVVTNIFSLSLKKWELSLYLFPYLKSYYFSKEKQSVQCSQFLYSLLFYAITLSISP